MTSIYLVMSCQWFTGESKCPSEKLIAEFAIPKVMFHKGHLPSCLSVPVLVWGMQNCFSYMKTVCWHHGSQTFFLTSLSPFPLLLALPSIFPESLLWASALSRNPPYRNRVLWINSAKVNRKPIFQEKKGFWVCPCTKPFFNGCRLGQTRKNLVVTEKAWYGMEQPRSPIMSMLAWPVFGINLLSWLLFFMGPWDRGASSLTSETANA